MSSPRAKQQRPNVLWLMTDQHHYQALGCMGNVTVKTPNLDRLAEQGMLFRRAYAPSAVCGPSRAALFSGLYPSANGVLNNRWSFNDGVRLLPTLLRNSGYDTALVGKLHLAPIHDSHGFDTKWLNDAIYDLYCADEPLTSAYARWLADRDFGGDVEKVISLANADERLHREGQWFDFFLGHNWRDEDAHDNTWVTDRACEYLSQQRTDPFFLYVSYFGPHHPFAVPGRWSTMYSAGDMVLPDEYYASTADKPAYQVDEARWSRNFDWNEEQARQLMAAYYGHVSMIDDGIGRIMDQLAHEGMADNTIVIMTADHGDHCGQFGLVGKGTMYEGSIHVPLIIRDPDFGTAGDTCDRTANGIDLYATLLERAQVTDWPTTSSRSMVGLLADPDDPSWVDQTYCELMSPGAVRQAVVRDNYKLLRVQDQRGQWRYEMYDLSTHPTESANLFETPDNQTLRGELTASLEERATLAATALDGSR